jgi:general secretion pathway protein F
MTTFVYRAYDASGVLRHGEVSAPSETAALAQLAARGQYPIELRAESTTGRRQRWWEIEIWTSGKREQERTAAHIRALSDLVAAQVPLEEALRLMREQEGEPVHQQEMVARLHASITGGSSLSDAMSAEAAAFPGHVVALVRSGERSGRLGAVLQELASLLESAAKQRAELGQALLYPIILLVAAAAALALVVTVLVPTIMPLFRDAGVAPPAAIALLDNLISLVLAYWPMLLALALASGFGATLMARAEISRLAFDRLLLRLPVVRDLVSDMQTFRLTHTLATLTGNGVPMLEAVRVMSDALDNRVFRSAASSIEEGLKAGRSLSECLAGTGLFPAVLVRLVAIGERTGALDAMLQRLAEQSRMRVERRMRSAMALLAPTMTLVIGGIVGGLILSVMSAINGLNDLVLR